MPIFKRLIEEAWARTKKFFFGSLAVTLATFGTLYFRFEWSWYWSILGGILFVVVVNYSLLLSVSVKLLKEKDEEFDKLRKAIKSKQGRDERSMRNGTKYYGEVLVDLKSIFSVVHELRREEKDLTEEAILNCLEVMCNVIKQMFERRGAGVVYSVSIKLPVKDKTNKVTTDSEMYTLVRDASSAQKRSKHENVVHKISENTCYLYVFNNRRKKTDEMYYLNQNITDDLSYMNSSLDAYKNWSSDFNQKQRKSKWPLPYRSELVVPISSNDFDNKEGKKLFLGYLCVDCSKENGFHEKYDHHCMLGLTEGIYDIMENLVALKGVNREINV